MSYTLEEVASHNTKESCWIIVHDKVFNVTKFLKDHPGGAHILLSVGGKDATESFDMFHRASILAKYAPRFCIGDLVKS